MKILLKRKHDSKYLNTFGGWTAEISLAREFESGVEALGVAGVWCALPIDSYVICHHWPKAPWMDLEGGKEIER